MKLRNKESLGHKKIWTHWETWTHGRNSRGIKGMAK